VFEKKLGQRRGQYLTVGMVLGKLFIHKPERPSGRQFHGGEFNGSLHSSTGWDIAAEHADAWGVHKSVKGLGKSNRYSNLRNALLRVTESTMRAIVVVVVDGH
jgi:hypothetical protein